MGRSRSRSPTRRVDRGGDQRRRSRSRERDRKRDSNRDRDRERYPRRSRSRSPVISRRRSRSKSRERTDKEKVNTSGPTNPKLLPKPAEVSEADAAEISPEDQEMMLTMGFAGFDTTKGKQVEGNNIYQANLLRKRRYRQYMNRRGGFNRPLDFIA